MNPRFLAAAFLAVAVVLGAVLLVYRGLSGGHGIGSGAGPHHVFISDERTDGEVLDCGIGRQVDDGAALGQRGLVPCRIGSAWSAPLQSPIWHARREDELTVSIARPAPRRLVMTCEAQPHADGDLVQTLVVTVNGRPLRRVEVPREWAELSLPVPERAQRPGNNRIRFAFAYEVASRSGDRARRSPMVAARFRRLALELDPRVKDARRDRRHRSPVSGARSVYHPRRARFVVSEPGRLVVPITIPDGASGIGLEIKVPRSLDRSRTTVKLTIEGVDGTPRRTLRLPLEDRSLERSPGVLGGEIPVDEFRGGACLLTFDVDPRPRGRALEIAPPTAVVRSSNSLADDPQQPAAPSHDRRPDIVLITLDAARPDRFGCYGYHRPTTPNIDRLAAGSLVFENAFSLAPYTRCSVPTMITGLSFVDHGVISDLEVLSGAATTLAEYLGEAGYRTACFSANPNNSRARGFDQGYDEFFEVWGRRSGGRLVGPHRTSRRALEWLASQDETTPLHLQLHYLPPHTPYDPSPAFDLFTDPTYDGRFTGAVRTLRAINDGRLRPTDADLGHIAALYDGNLRAVDDAVGMVLQALRQRARWRDTVVLVTSDHGDGFLEHGRMGHNSTLFDEMLRVPFILRTPFGDPSGEVDVGRLVSLADLVPTLIGRAGLEPRHGLDGIDLLAAAGATRPALGRYLVLRDAHDPPLLGLRSLRWKVMLAPSGHGALYDVRRDPAERDDLVLDRPGVFAGLAQLISDRISRPALVPPAAAPPEVDEADRKMLRALGYTD